MNQYDRYRESQALRMINERLKDRAERRQYAEILRGSIKFQAYALQRALKICRFEIRQAIKHEIEPILDGFIIIMGGKP